MKVTLAIPNYNGSSNLPSLLDRVLRENFDDIYVLDDRSTDNSLEILSQFQDRVKIIKGEANVGAGANRNRITRSIDEGIIMFLDADMELITESVVEKIKGIFENPAIGVVGGLILTKEDKPMDWNFGPLMHPARDAYAAAVHEVAQQHLNDHDMLDYLSTLIEDYAPSWSIFGIKPIERQVGWVAEGNFCIRAELFKSIGGYDVKMRHHETQDLNKRIQDAGGRTLFNPAIVARHLDIDVRGETRQKDFRDAQLYFYQKHWGMSKDVFNKLHEA